MNYAKTSIMVSLTLKKAGTQRQVYRMQQRFQEAALSSHQSYLQATTTTVAATQVRQTISRSLPHTSWKK